jgi:hypothetical protein
MWTMKDLSRLYASETKLLQHTTRQIRQDNRSGKAVVLNELHKITNNILQSLLSLCKRGGSKTQISESLP